MRMLMNWLVENVFTRTEYYDSEYWDVDSGTYVQLAVLFGMVGFFSSSHR